MTIIRIFTNFSCPNSRAYNFPLLLTKNILKDFGYKLHFELNLKANYCDCAFINSNLFRCVWQSKKSEIFNFLEKLRLMKAKIIWFDTTDSTWCTQFEVMPYVDKFLKAQLFIDKNLYLQSFRTGRIFTDYFDNLYNSGEREVHYPSAKREDIAKIGLSWNSCFENYNEQRYSLGQKIRNKLRPYTAGMLGERIRVDFTEPSRSRTEPISCRVGTSHSRPSVAAHRKAIMERLEKYGVRKGKIPLPSYFAELRNSKIAVSPFGVGEITLRDYEIIICGAALLKPDMSHLDTWPDLFSDKTCLTFKWDLSDLEEKIDFLLSNSEKRLEMAENAQKIYRHHLSEEGIAEFAQRLISAILCPVLA